MQLMLTTDYAVRAMLYLAEKHEYISSQEISKACAIDRDFAQKILRKLRNAGLVSVQMGATGGYTLAREAKDISMGEVLTVMEETMCLNRCTEDEGQCGKDMTARCSARNFYAAVQEQLDKILNETSLQDIIDGHSKETIATILEARSA